MAEWKTTTPGQWQTLRDNSSDYLHEGYITDYGVEITNTITVEYEQNIDIEYEHSMMIRLYMFNSFGLIGGLAALVWAAWILHKHRRSGGKDSVFIITLLFIDTLELVAVCTMFPFEGYFPNLHTYVACFALRFLSVCFHQLVALEGVAAVTHPHVAAVFSSLPCSVSTAFVTFLLVGFSVGGLFFFDQYYLSFLAITTIVPVLIHAVMYILICSRAKPNQAPARGITEKTVLVESLVSYLLLHGPCLVATAMLLMGYHQLMPHMCFSISSLWVMTDCLLVVLVCRLPRVQCS